MKDYLQDIVKHTHALGFIDLVKVTGTATETKIDAVSEDRTAIVQAQFHNPVPDLVGTFGMPNLGKLNTILNIPEYSEGAKLTISKTDAGPAGVNFENAAGDFKNDYRFMSSTIVMTN